MSRNTARDNTETSRDAGPRGRAFAYQALQELRRVNEARVKAVQVESAILARWREEDGGRRKARMFACERPAAQPGAK